MKSIVLVAIGFTWLLSSSAWAIECQSARGDPKTGWYSWREIDGRRCWFKKVGAMPPKSELHWPVKEGREEPPRAPAAPVSPPEQSASRPERPAASAPERIVPAPPPRREATTTKTQPETATVSHFTTLSVRPTGAAPRRPSKGPIDLMNGASVSSMEPFGEARQKPARSADPFAARFTGKTD
jgi:hypothetical protein